MKPIKKEAKRDLEIGDGKNSLEATSERKTMASGNDLSPPKDHKCRDSKLRQRRHVHAHKSGERTDKDVLGSEKSKSKEGSTRKRRDSEGRESNTKKDKLKIQNKIPVHHHHKKESHHRVKEEVPHVSGDGHSQTVDDTANSTKPMHEKEIKSSKSSDRCAKTTTVTSASSKIPVNKHDQAHSSKYKDFPSEISTPVEVLNTRVSSELDLNISDVKTDLIKTHQIPDINLIEDDLNEQKSSPVEVNDKEISAEVTSLNGDGQRMKGTQSQIKFSGSASKIPQVIVRDVHTDGCANGSRSSDVKLRGGSDVNAIDKTDQKVINTDVDSGKYHQLCELNMENTIKERNIVFDERGGISDGMPAVVKPLNILVYADSTVAKENVKEVLNEILNREK